jgi:hypothetical protein
MDLLVAPGASQTRLAPRHISRYRNARYPWILTDLKLGRRDSAFQITRTVFQLLRSTLGKRVFQNNPTKRTWGKIVHKLTDRVTCIAAVRDVPRGEKHLYGSRDDEETHVLEA